MTTSNNKNFLYGVMIIIVLVAIYLVFGNSIKNISWFKNPSDSQKVEPTTKPVTDQIPQNQLPSALPSDIPIEKDAVISRNEVVRLPNGEIQYIRKFISKKTVAENYKIYKAYISNTLKWTIKVDTNTATFASLMADKDESGVLGVIISKNNITNDISVELNMVIK